MKRSAFWLLAILVVVAFQGSAAHFMIINGVKPDIVMIFVLLSGVLYGRAQGLVAGFFCGLFVDLLNSGLFGFYTFVFMPVGVLAGMMQKSIFEDNFLLPLIMVAAASCAVNLALQLCIFLAGNSWPYWPDVLVYTADAALYNMAAALPMLFLFNKLKKSVNAG